MATVLTGKLIAIQLYSDGTAEVMAAIQAARAVTNKCELISALSSYGGNPMACAATLASIKVIERDEILQNVRSAGNFLNLVFLMPFSK